MSEENSLLEQFVFHEINLVWHKLTLFFKELKYYLSLRYIECSLCAKHYGQECQKMLPSLGFLTLYKISRMCVMCRSTQFLIPALRRSRQIDLSEFKAILVYIVRSGSSWATWWDPFLRKNDTVHNLCSGAFSF